MSTIAINRENYTLREENVSLKERIKNYFTENAAIISAGLLSLNLPAVQTAEIMSRGTAQNEETE